MPSLPTPTFSYPPFTPSPTISYPYFVRSEPVDALHQPFQPFHMAPQSTELSAGAMATFDKLKTRSALHIKLLAEDVERFRDFKPKAESDKQSMLRDVGILLQLRSQTVESVFAIIKGPQDKVDKVKNAELKKLIEKMRGKWEDSYIETVEHTWSEFDKKKCAAGEQGVRYYKDLGLLMQFSAEQHCALVEKLLGMVQTGEIEEDPDEVVMGRKNFEFYFMREERGKWVVVADEGAGRKRKMDGEGTACKKRKALEEKHAQGEHRAQKKKKMVMKTEKIIKTEKTDDGEKRREYVPNKYVPKKGEWKCGKCGWYSVGGWCTKKDWRGMSMCIGRREG